MISCCSFCLFSAPGFRCCGCLFCKSCTRRKGASAGRLLNHMLQSEPGILGITHRSGYESAVIFLATLPYFLHKEKRDEVYFISFLSFKSISAPFVSKNLYCRNEKLWLGSTFIPIPYFSLHCAFIENTPLFIYAAT